MRKRKYIHRLWCFDFFQFEQAEAWLADMAATGWRLKSVGLRFAKFERCEPELLRYRCVPENFTLFLKRDEDLQVYLNAGWKYAGHHDHMMVYSAPDHESIPELPMNAEWLCDRMKRTRRWRRGLYIAVALMVFIFLAAVVLISDGSSLAANILVWLLSATLGMAAVLLIRIFRDAAATIKRLEQGLITHRQPYRMTMALSKAAALVALLLYVAAPFLRSFQP